MGNSLNQILTLNLTNRTGGNVTRGDVVIISSANNESFISASGSALSTDTIGVILDTNTIANGANASVAVGGYIPQINLDASSNLGDTFGVSNVAKKASPHNSVQTGDFGQVLSAGTTPSAVLWGNPQQNLSPSFITGTNLGWFNVKDYGAIGNGITDDTIAIQNAIIALTGSGGGILYFPFGTYSTIGGFNIAAPCIIRGDGNSAQFSTTAMNAASQIICTTATGTLFTVSNKGVSFEDLYLACTHSTPTAGAAITITTPGSATMFVHQHIRNCTINGFYRNIDMQTAFMWHLEGCYILNPVVAGIRINNELWGDWGDFTISNCIFHPGQRNTAVGVEYKGGGGMMMMNTKFDGFTVIPPNPPPQPTDLFRFVRQVDIAFRQDSSNIQISNCSFENWGTEALRISTTGTIGCRNIILNGLQFGGYTTSGSAVVIGAGNLGAIERVTIGDTVFHTDTPFAPAVSLTKVQKVRIDNVINDGFPNFLIQTGCADVLNLELADFQQNVYNTGSISLGTTTAGFYSNADATNAKITFTPPSYGRYKVTFTFTHHMDGTGIEVFFRLNDGTTSSPAIANYNPTGVSERPLTLSYIFAWQPTSQTVTLQKRNVGGTITTNQIVGNATAGVELGLYMSVERIGT